MTDEEAAAVVAQLTVTPSSLLRLGYEPPRDVVAPDVRAWADAEMRAWRRRAEAIRTLRERHEREVAWLRASLMADNTPVWLVEMVIERWDTEEGKRP